MIAASCASLNVEPNAGIEPTLPARMRAMISLSVSAVSMSLGPLPASRPPLKWHQPQLVAKSWFTSTAAGTPGDAATAAVDWSPAFESPEGASAAWRPDCIGPGRSGVCANDPEQTNSALSNTANRQTPLTAPRLPEDQGRAVGPHPRRPGIQSGGRRRRQPAAIEACTMSLRAARTPSARPSPSASGRTRRRRTWRSRRRRARPSRS